MESDKKSANEEAAQFTPAAGSQAGSLDIGSDVQDRVFPLRSVMSIATDPSLILRPNDGEEASARQALGSPNSEGSLDRGRLQSMNSWRSQVHASQSQQSTDGSDLESDGISRHRSSSADHFFGPPSTRTLHGTGDTTGPGAGGYFGAAITARFTHVTTDRGHAIDTGRAGEALKRCEDEPIHIPGAIQSFGALVAVQPESDGRLAVRIVSENSQRVIGYSPEQLFRLESFTDILSGDQAENLLDSVDFVRGEGTDVAANGPEVLTMSIRDPNRRNHKVWCALHISVSHPELVICEFELEKDPDFPLVPATSWTSEGSPEDTLDGEPTQEELKESTESHSRPLRVLRNARKRGGEAGTMEVFSIISQVEEQLTQARTLKQFLKVLVGVVKELTGFHRIMIYQFDNQFNGRVVTELLDPKAAKDLYQGLHFPASDIPKQARELYRTNKVRLLYDRDQQSSRLVGKSVGDLERPLDLTHSHLRAMSPIHIKYLSHMAVRSSMSISINAFGDLWGLIACHTYGPSGTRVSFPIRKICRLISDSATRNIERISYTSRLQARKLISTSPTSTNPSGAIIASSEDLLSLFDSEFGLLSIYNETKIMGKIQATQEVLALLEYIRVRRFDSIIKTHNIRQDFKGWAYGSSGMTTIAGLLLIPLSTTGEDFIVFFRRAQNIEVKWAGNPYEKFLKARTEGCLEPRESFKAWTETLLGTCREWTEEEMENAGTLCLVYGKFIEVWRHRRAAVESTDLTKLLLQNSAHEVRTPLNAIINYLEVALEGNLEQETRDSLTKSYSASKSLIYVINDLLDLTKTEAKGPLAQDEEGFDPCQCFHDAVDVFTSDAGRKNIQFEIVEGENMPALVLGERRRVRQAISNLTANAIEATSEGSVRVEMRAVSRSEAAVDLEITVTDSGKGMSAQQVDDLFADLEELQREDAQISFLGNPTDSEATEAAATAEQNKRKSCVLGLGLAVVARVVRNMNGQLRLRSEAGKGSRFTIILPFGLPASAARATLPIPNAALDGTKSAESEKASNTGSDGDVTLIAKGPKSIDSRPAELARRSSSSSTHSRGSAKSGKSIKSTSTAGSSKSDVDLLIETIQAPHSLERQGTNDSVEAVRKRGVEAGPSKQHDAASQVSTAAHSPLHEEAHLRHGPQGSMGSVDMADSNTPLRAVRMPIYSSLDSLATPPENYIADSLGQGAGSGEIYAPQAANDSSVDESARATEADRPVIPGRYLTSVENPATDGVDRVRMKVLVAEDDPINSKILEKRLQKIGHDVTVTANGQECLSTYEQRPGFFDLVLMDMQMPIMDGMTSCSTIRSFEKSHALHALSQRAKANGRVPIMAVSASLVERERQTYIDAGFDGWMLKPVSISRLRELMRGIVDAEMRAKHVYTPGCWESGGWFGLPATRGGG